MAKEIVWSKNALSDRFRIYKYWEFHNKSDGYSKKIETLFQSTANLLSTFPELGIRTTKEGIQVKVVKTFKIFYSVEIDRIQILRVWDARQNPETLKLI